MDQCRRLSEKGWPGYMPDRKRPVDLFHCLELNLEKLGNKVSMRREIFNLKKLIWDGHAILSNVDVMERVSRGE